MAKISNILATIFKAKCQQIKLSGLYFMISQPYLNGNFLDCNYKVMMIITKSFEKAIHYMIMSMQDHNILNMFWWWVRTLDPAISDKKKKKKTNGSIDDIQIKWSREKRACMHGVVLIRWIWSWGYNMGHIYK